jgi:hypothetical protein
MKKKLKIMASVLMITAFAATICTSCSKDEKEDGLDSLAGTTWVESSGEGALSFLDNSNCRVVINGYGDISGTYSYTPPNITILLADPNLAANVMTGTVSGDTMELTIRRDGKEFTGTFVKR